MKCYGCREACPLCFCDDCCLEAEGPEWVPGGYTPAAPFFHLTRMVHMVDSCTNCGQCTEVCPCEIPVAKVWSTVNNKIRDVYGYLPGFDNGEPIPFTEHKPKDNWKQSFYSIYFFFFKKLILEDKNLLFKNSF